MSAGGPRRIGDLLQFGDIGRLRTEAAARRELAAQVRAVLPAPEAAHVVSARLDDQGGLVVGMDSAAWAARVRYGTSELLGRPVIRVHVTAPGGDGD
jgi:Dna[CI] antecedent, DciA